METHQSNQLGVRPTGLPRDEVLHEARRQEGRDLDGNPHGQPIGATEAVEQRGGVQSGVLHGHFDIEAIAAWLCGKSGGDWAKPYTKRRVWMRRALALTALADQRLSKGAATAEARKIMEAA